MTLCFLTLWSSEWVESLLLLLKLAFEETRVLSKVYVVWCMVEFAGKAKSNMKKMLLRCCQGTNFFDYIVSWQSWPSPAYLLEFPRSRAAAKEKALIVLYAWDALFSLTLLLLSWEHQLEKTAFSSVGSHLKTPSNIQWCISNRSLLLLNKSLLVIVPSEIVNPKKRNRKCCYFSFLALPFSSNTRCTCERSLHLELDS